MSVADTRAVLHALVSSAIDNSHACDLINDLSYTLVVLANYAPDWQDRAHELADLLASEITPGIDVEAET